MAKNILMSGHKLPRYEQEYVSPTQALDKILQYAARGSDRLNDINYINYTIEALQKVLGALLSNLPPEQACAILTKGSDFKFEPGTEHEADNHEG